MTDTASDRISRSAIGPNDTEKVIPMSTTWDRVHRRTQLTNDVIATWEGGHPIDPAQLAAIENEFAGMGGFLSNLYASWARTYDARLDALLESSPYNLRAALGALAADVNASQPAVSSMLAAYADNPELAAARRRHALRTLAMTGIDIPPAMALAS